MDPEAMGWFDTHCHLTPDQAVDSGFAASQSSVSGICIVGTDSVEGLKALEAAELVNRSDCPIEAYAALGIHPHDAADKEKGDLVKLETAVATASSTLVGIGECGLDYFYEHSPREAQMDHFAFQIDMANRYGLTLIIHTRDAWSDTFSVLSDQGWPDRVIFHCFVGGLAEARRALDAGAWISLSGILTFKNSAELQEVARYVPDDRLLIETDTPYLTPVPHRGKPNQPAYVSLVGEKLAELKKCDIGHMQGLLWENSRRAFNIG